MIPEPAVTSLERTLRRHTWHQYDNVTGCIASLMRSCNRSN
ncbi:MAG: hypothetical protein PW790_02000 [Parvibaculaceae bacterium]|nr:hypothetical protein [Parvibaculaceae bacterium]